ncbi:(Dimethylallyl)adenosine tRNA methylthiotransferase MiaB [bacterium BMS3Abin15]|nr:(Dimethylallyl)adenosine tRNA methylthiotransferase MiaB [bacterium BMS3Abin15]
MKIIFIYNGAENLGIEYISSYLKSKGHEVYLLFDPAVFSGDYLINNKLFSRILNIEKKIIQKTIDLKPDIVAFSAFTGNFRWCLNIAQEIKKLSNVPIVFGGVHSTAVPDEVLSNDCIDFAVIGEGEHAMLDLLEHMEKGTGREALLNTPNICFTYQGDVHMNTPRPYIKDLDSLPFPDKFLFYDKVPFLEEKYLITTSRGCPYSCTYCSNNMYHKIYCTEKQHVRRRSPDNVIEELIYFKKRGRVKLVSFADDVFTFSKSWLEDFIEKYRSRINLPFFCSVHPLSITEEKAALLKEGGCCLVTMGVQSGSERIRKEVFERHGSNDKIIESINQLKNAGIKVSVDNIFGAPSETEDDLKESLELYKEAKTDRILTFWLTYYPKTSIISYAEDHDILSKNDIKNIEKGHTGFAHNTGSVSEDKIELYSKYEILFHIRSLIHNNRLFSLVSKVVIHIPFKKAATKIVALLNAVKNRDFKAFYLIKYIWSEKHVP